MQLNNRPSVPPGLPPRVRSASGKTTRKFASVEHLSTEAVAAFVDGELSPGATHRAKVHLVHCAECRNEVAVQRRAAAALRQAHQADAALCAPTSLVARLTSIAEEPSTMDGDADRGTGEPAGTTPAWVGQGDIVGDGVAKIFAVLRRTRRPGRGS